MDHSIDLLAIFTDLSGWIMRYCIFEAGVKMTHHSTNCDAHGSPRNIIIGSLIGEDDNLVIAFYCYFE